MPPFSSEKGGTQGISLIISGSAPILKIFSPAFYAGFNKECRLGPLSSVDLCEGGRPTDILYSKDCIGVIVFVHILLSDTYSRGVRLLRKIRLARQHLQADFDSGLGDKHRVIHSGCAIFALFD